MFGPDICGFGTRKTHVILPYKGKNHLIKKDIKAETDTLTHVYTLRIMPNNTYQVRANLCCGWGRGLLQQRSSACSKRGSPHVSMHTLPDCTQH